MLCVRANDADAIDSQRCSGALSKLLNIVFTTSSFGNGDQLFAATLSAKSPDSRSPLAPAPRVPNGMLKPVTSPIKPRFGLNK
jgi:hypothetical protein